MPAVSVILPTYNRTRYLRPAVESVYGQTLGDWELIVADDGSGEETRTYLSSLSDPRVRTLWLRHSGNPSRVRNAAIEVATGRYLAFLDSDDVWAPTKLAKQIQALSDHPARGWCYSGRDYIDDTGRPVAAAADREVSPPDGWVLEPLLTLDLSIAMPTLVAERALVNAIGRFDERQEFGEFHDLCLRLAERSQVVALGEVLCSVRRHDEHYSGDRLAAYQSWDRLYAKMVALAPTSRVRSRCRQLRANASLVLAGLRARRGDYRGVCGLLARSSLFSWQFPRWWFGAVKQVVRPLVPRFVLETYERGARRQAT